MDFISFILFCSNSLLKINWSEGYRVKKIIYTRSEKLFYRKGERFITMAKISELIELASTKTGLSKEEVLLRIRNKQKELSGLVSEEGAAYIVANELGVRTRNKVVETILKLDELKPEMKSVSVMGRVKAIHGPREFTTKTGVRNKVVNMEVVDATGVGRVVLWNMHDIEKVEKGTIGVGQVIQVRSGYIRESNFTNSLEVHVGNKGILIENPEGVDEEDFPKEAVSNGRNFNISELQPNAPVNLAAKITAKYEIKEFDKNGRKGKVANLIINDGTASTRLVLWNEKTDLLNDLQVGDIVKIENGYTKEGMRGVEVQANSNTTLTRNPEGVKISEIKEEKAKRVLVGQLKEGEFSEVKGAITAHFGNNFVHDMCASCNKKITFGKCDRCGGTQTKKLLILNVSIDDGSGTVRAALFRETAEKLIGLKAEQAVDAQKVKASLDGVVGKDMVFEGRVKKNAQFDRLEFNVSSIKEFNAEKEVEKMVGAE